MNRRDTVIALFAVCAIGSPLEVGAQTPRKIWRIGILGPLDGATNVPYLNELRAGLREAGYIEGQHFAFDERYANGKNEQLAGLAVEMVRLNVDIIVASTTNPARAAQKATGTIPIVFVAVADPVASGFADTLARPGRNMTGMSNFSGDLGPKRLELLKLAIPKLSRVAFLTNPTNSLQTALVPRLRSAADAIGLQLFSVNLNAVDDIDTVFSKIAREGAEAIFVGGDVYHFAQRQQISDAAIKYRIALITPFREYTEAGSLMSYGTNVLAQFRRTAAYVDQIFRGAKPQDLPIEQPTVFELVLNAKTAKALGLTIPTELRLRADRVIE